MATADFGWITMSLRELDRIKVIESIIEGRLKPRAAALRLRVTARLASQRRGKPSNHQLPAGLEQRAVRLIRERYPDFGPTLAREKLAECHGLRLAKETVRRLMVDAGLWVPRKQRPPKIHQPRNRRACRGELIQIDGSDHRWFEERGPACTLLVYIDDATSQLMHLHFTESESTFGYFTATRAYLQRHGKPRAFYSDKASVFRSNHKEPQGGAGHTQFVRALYELNIDSLCANSSQAKGRVERANLTLKDRLVKELRLRGLSTMADANAFLPHFIADYNARFAKAPRSDHDAHRPVRDDENMELIFAWQESRRLSKSLTVQYDNVLYLLTDTPHSRRLAGRYIQIFHCPDGCLEPLIRNA